MSKLPYEKYIKKYLGCTPSQAHEMATVYQNHSFPELKQALRFMKHKITEKPKEPLPRAVRLIGQKVAPRVKYCPHCNTVLDYWHASEGPVWCCRNCNRMVEKEGSTHA